MTLARIYCWLAGHDWDNPQQYYEKPRCERCGHQGGWY